MESIVQHSSSSFEFQYTVSIARETRPGGPIWWLCKLIRVSTNSEFLFEFNPIHSLSFGYCTVARKLAHGKNTFFELCARSRSRSRFLRTTVGSPIATKNDVDVQIENFTKRVQITLVPQTPHPLFYTMTSSKISFPRSKTQPEFRRRSAFQGEH